jgi:MtN3 and saliva related transmembrane protein
MEMFLIETVGLAAGCFTTCAFIPQVVRTYRSRSVKDISFRMYLLMCAGILLWVLYGALIGSLSVIVANVVSFALTAAILVMKVTFERKSRPCSRVAPSTLSNIPDSGEGTP